MWSGSFLGHHSQIADNTFIASSTVISGATTIGEHSFIGANATIRDNLKVGRYNLIWGGCYIREYTGL